jgi:hypothetical protein
MAQKNKLIYNDKKDDAARVAFLFERYQELILELE